VCGGMLIMITHYHIVLGGMGLGGVQESAPSR
jgi:hypothetical protein